jgi:hypothetical protein
MAKERKSRTFNPRYETTGYGFLAGFEHPFERELDSSNRWVVLAKLIPWDEICKAYLNKMGKSGVVRRPVNPRIVLGSLIIKYMCGLNDRETVDRISENIYMQYFLGYPSFTSEKPFDASLFVEIRKRLSMETINAINEKIVRLKTHFEETSHIERSRNKEASVKTDAVEKAETYRLETDKEELQSEYPGNSPAESPGNGPAESKESNSAAKTGLPPDCASDRTDNPAETNKGRLLIDATVCPQNIAYPTDLDLLSEAREKSEQLIDSIYNIESTPKSI